MTYSLIAAISQDYAIGKGNKLLWNVPEDLKRFRSLTMGKTVVMGHRTYDSLPKKPLDGRRNIVLSSNEIPGCTCVRSIEDVVAMCGEEENFVIGGESVYRQFLKLSDKLYLTKVLKHYPSADKFFPMFCMNDWKLTLEMPGRYGELSYLFQEYVRR